jgi:hypothetical protein
VKGALQSELNVSRKGDKLSNIVLTVKSGKQKDEDQSDEFEFCLKKLAIDGEWKPDGRPVTSLVLQPLSAVPAHEREPEEGSVEWIALQLDRANVPVEFGRRRLAEECQRLGFKVGNDRLNEVAGLRKQRSQERSYSQVTQTVLDDGTDKADSAGQTGPGPVQDHPGPAPENRRSSPSSLRRGPVVQEGPECAGCHGKLDVFFASHGHDRHPGC